MLGLWHLGVTSLLTFNLYKNLQKRLVLRENSELPEGHLSDLTLAIPVRNEVQNISVLIPQIVDSRQKPKNLIFLNDQSTDATLEVIHNWQKKYSWIKVIDGSDLPVGWRGKVWALQQLLRAVETESVLFMDADVRFLSPFSLGTLYQEFSLRKGSQLVSVFPKLRGNFSAHLLLDQVAFHLNYFLPFSVEKLPTKSAVAATGQILLAKTKDLRDLNAFGRIRGTTHDGLQLARVFSNSGRNVVSFDGQNLFECFMYSDLPQAFQGFSRNALEAYGNNKTLMIAMSGMVFWIFVMPYFIWPLMLADPAFLVSFLMVLLGQLMLAQQYKMSMASVLSAPLKSTASVAVNIWSLARPMLRMQTQWKGRLLNHG
jgi:hypothetical protein